MVDIDGNPWFVAADVIFALSYSRVDAALRVLNETERMVLSPSATPPTWGGEEYRTIFGSPARNVSLISEPGLYTLIMRSDKQEAKEFQDWVTRDVLPAIRKDGAYVKDQEKVATGEMTATPNLNSS